MPSVKQILIAFFFIYAFQGQDLSAAPPVSSHRSQFEFTKHEKYSFKSCEKFNGGSHKYVVTCENGSFQAQPVAGLARDLQKVSRAVVSNDVLLNLKKHVSNKMQESINAAQAAERCLASVRRNQNCTELVQRMRNVARNGLPLLRKNMALMSAPSMRGLQIFSDRVPEDKRFNKNIEHPQRSMYVRPISNAEKKEILEAYDEDTQKYRDEWPQYNKNHRCVEIIRGEARLKPGPYCEQVTSIEMNTFITSRRDTDREAYYKEEYYSILKQAPFLGVMSESELPENDISLDPLLAMAMRQIASEAQGAKIKFDKMDVSDTTQLFQYPELIESYLKNQKPLDRTYCDATESLFSLYKSGGKMEWIKNIGLVTAGILGGGACVLSGGIICAVGVAVGVEGISVASDQNKLSNALILNQAGLVSGDKVQDARNSRNLSLLLAPVSFVGLKGGGRIIARAENRSIRALVTRNSKFQSAEALNARYLEFSPTTVAQNKKWITAAKENSADYFYEVENGALKRLNDTLGDKNLVTSFTNLHKDILFREMKELQQKFPGVVIDSYSDFKSSRFAFHFPGNKKPANFDEALRQVHQKTNDEFSMTVKGVAGLNIPAQENPITWFNSGLGKTADEASLASRHSRSVEINRTIHFEDIRLILDAEREVIEKSRRAFEASFKKNGTADVLLEKTASGAMIPKVGVFELLRKTSASTDKDLAQELSAKFGIRVSDEEAALLNRYYRQTDKFSPGLWMDERVMANLDSAEFGGFSVDFKGMGAKNIQQVASDLAQTSGQGLETTVARIRLGEEKVTRDFDRAKLDFQTTVNAQFTRLGIRVQNRCSGDDCVSLPSQALTKEQQREVVRALANSVDKPADYRLSFIPENVPANLRTQLSVQGELIEKAMRSRLTGFGTNQLPSSLLDKIIFAIDMPKDLKTGRAKLIMDVHPGTTLDSRQLRLIHEEFERQVSNGR